MKIFYENRLRELISEIPIEKDGIRTEYNEKAIANVIEYVDELMLSQYDKGVIEGKVRSRDILLEGVCDAILRL